MDESKSKYKKKDNKGWIESEEYSNFLANRSEIRLIKNKFKKKEAIIQFNKRQEFRSKMESCDKLELDKIGHQELISFKNNILFNRGKFEQSITSINIGILALIISALAIVISLSLKSYELFNQSNISQLILCYVYIILLVTIIIVLNKVFAIPFDVKYGHNNSLLGYQLKLVEEELERRKSESIESKVQSPSIQSNQSSKRKEIRENRNSKHRS